MKVVWVAPILVLVAGLSVPPASASCVGTMADTEIRSANGTDPAYRSFIWSQSVFDPFYFESYPPLAYQPPFTAQLKATFWSLGQGDPALLDQPMTVKAVGPKQMSLGVVFSDKKLKPTFFLQREVLLFAHGAVEF